MSALLRLREVVHGRRSVWHVELYESGALTRASRYKDRRAARAVAGMFAKDLGAVVVACGPDANTVPLPALLADSDKTTPRTSAVILEQPKRRPTRRRNGAVRVFQQRPGLWALQDVEGGRVLRDGLTRRAAAGLGWDVAEELGFDLLIEGNAP